MACWCRSKSWVEEEGEVFRKGVVLLNEETMEGEAVKWMRFEEARDVLASKGGDALLAVLQGMKDGTVSVFLRSP